MKTPALTEKLFCYATGLLWLLVNAVLLTAAETPNSPARTTITDAEIREVVTQVARHQLHPMADGNYAAVTTLKAAQAALPPRGIAWNYQWGVTLSGLLRAAEVTGDTNLNRFVEEHNAISARYFAWLTGIEKQFNSTNATAFVRSTSLKELMTLGSLDYCGAMGTALLDSRLLHPEPFTPEQKIVLGRIADWVANRQARQPDGTLWRPESGMGPTVWPDDLYMGGVFLARWGQFTREPRFIEDAANQLIHQAALQQDTDGLWFHGYFVNDKKHAPFKWGRGNGWVTLTLVETIAALPNTNSLRPQLLDIFRKQMDGLKKVQATDGAWRQVLDQPALWEETSCTAMFAYGIARAVNEGWIDATNMTIARQAFAGVARNVTADGMVNGTSKGTSIGRDLEYYAKRPQPDDDLHGRGAVLFAGSEILRAARK